MHNSSFKFCQKEKQHRTSNKRLIDRRKKAERPVARNEEREGAQWLEVSRLVVHGLVSGIAEVLAQVRGVRVLEAISETRGAGALLEKTPATRCLAAGNGETQVDECTDFVRAAARLSGALINPDVLVQTKQWRRVRVHSPAAQRACASSRCRRALELEALRADYYKMYQALLLINDYTSISINK